MGERRGRQCGRRRRHADSIGAGFSRGVQEVDGVHAIAAAALGVVQHVVEDGQAAEVIVFADLVRLGLGQLGHRKAAYRRGQARSLLRFRLQRRIDDLRASSQHNAAGLRIAAVAGVASGVEEVRSVAVVQNCRAAIVAAIGVGLGEGEAAAGVERRYGAEEILAHRVGSVHSIGGV
jgi:hypothetical protein